jgi:plasmid maintenance system antidote protein VapI
MNLDSSPENIKMSYELKIDPKKRAASRFIGKVRKALISAAIEEKKLSGISQKEIAEAIGVNKSVVSRMLKGESNLTLRSVGELAWALGWEPDFTLKRRAVAIHSNEARPEQARTTAQKAASSSNYNVLVYDKTRAIEPHASPLQAAE